MRPVTYTRGAAKDLRRYRNVAARIMTVMTEYAAGVGAHANNVTQLVGSTAKRMRVGDFRVTFEENAELIVVTKFAPRGSTYE